MEKRALLEIEKHIQVFEEIKANSLGQIVALARILYDALKTGKKILVAGNGGSAADAQHFVAELIGRYLVERPACAAIALTTDTSILTAVGNDYGFDHIFSRQVEGLGREGDVLIGISTSGKSANLIRAFEAARTRKVTTLALIGKTGEPLKSMADHFLLAPSHETPRIQEAHQWIWHTWCDLIDQWSASPP